MKIHTFDENLNYDIPKQLYGAAWYTKWLHCYYYYFCEATRET